MPTSHPSRPGRHELGQNFLVEREVITSLTDLVSRTRGPVIEIGAGDGALTLPLQRLGRPLTGLEIDDRRATRLARRVQPPTRIERVDFLHYTLPATPCVLVGNLPFHRTTAMLRRILRAPGWTDAVLLVQWEVARRRAGVGGATQMTAQWWPWFHFALGIRVPAAAFRPSPGVDGGVLTVSRRRKPLVPERGRQEYQDLVRRVFVGGGRGLGEIVARAAPGATRRDVHRWMGRNQVAARALPRDLTPSQWAGLYDLLRRSAGGP